MIRILIADDDPHIREFLRYILIEAGYDVLCAENGLVASRMLEEEQLHLAVVDVMMPAKNGLDLCKEIRAYYDIPVLLLTVKDTLADKEKGFMSGADDYIVKPFEPKELLLRVKALLRRYQMVSDSSIRLHGTVIDPKSHEVKIGGEVVTIPPKEFELLAQLASFPNRIFTREQLVQLIWGADYDGDSRTVDVHIKRLRDRFYPLTDDFVITTVRGLGYKLEAKSR